tara:strand:- start:2749 stop:4080 length:1332 start_codon:yes stop_codon:yes gene_type:complete
MKTELKKLHLTLICGLICSLTFCQVKLPKTPTVSTFKVITSNLGLPKSTLPSTNFPTSQPNGMAVYEQDRQRVAQQENELKQIYADLKTDRINYSLPSYGNIESTKHYRNAYNQISQLNTDDFSVKKATFIIENAYYEEQKNYAEFEKTIKQTGDFIREKMTELEFDQNSNLAKNYMLFKFFSDTLEIKSKNLKHLPFKYDFEDYMGIEDWSKMFVSKLLATGKGQCNSLPRLYLILAEEIGAEAFLSLSPNHSYIKFRDEDNNWYNVELTNGMFTTDSSILQSGFIKSEALQNEIYMQKMTEKQLLSQLLSDFAQGYARKFGYDTFVNQVIDKALELYPNSISANMMKSNYLTIQFEYVAQQVGINPRNHQELQNIRHYPKIVKLLNQVNSQYDQVDDLGFEFMSPEDYQKWLSSLQETKQQEDNEAMKKQFNIKLNQTIKN